MSGTGKKPRQRAEEEERLDETIEESFPASDPPPNTPVRRRGGDRHADEAKGTPHTERHESETAAGRQEGVRPAESKSE